MYTGKNDVVEIIEMGHKMVKMWLFDAPTKNGGIYVSDKKRCSTTGWRGSRPRGAEDSKIKQHKTIHIYCMCIYIYCIYQDILYYRKHAGEVRKQENNMKELQQSY